MRTLLILDDTLASSDLKGGFANATRIDLFPLISDWTGFDAVLTELSRTGVEVRVLDAARALDREVCLLREALPAWSTKVGDTVLDGRALKDWLQHRAGISAFWFGAIAEMNPLKTPELLTVAQVRAIDRQLADGGYDECVHLLGRSVLGRASVAMARARGVHARRIRCARRPIAGRLRACVAGGGGALRARLAASAVLARAAVWGLLARGLTLSRLAYANDREPLLFVTYFPYVDRERADAGVFVNKYAGPLQARLTDVGRPVWWLGLFVFVEGMGFRDAVRLARRFADTGERIALLEAYGTPRLLLGVLRDWIRLSRRAARLARSWPGPLGDGLVPAPAELVVQRLWLRSYRGVDLMRGLYYYALFRRVMDDAGAATQCLYCCEMQSWEFGLVAAARARQPRLPTIGFQHTTVSRNYYFYHHHRDDVAHATSPTGLPLPDILAANGDRPAQLLAESGYPGLVVVESLRFLGLRDGLGRSRPERSRRRPVVLVAGSIVRQETAALLSLVVSAFGGAASPDPPGGDVTLWLKGHPSQPVESVAAEAGLDLSRHVLRTGDIRELLPEADLVVVPTSAVAIEALAYGCEVVVPVFSALPTMTPLAGCERYYHRVHSPEELRHAVERFRREGALVDIDDKRRFVRSYWCLDPRLPRWERLLAGGRLEPVRASEERS